MTETEHLQDQFRRAIDGEAWFGSSLGEVLADVTAEMAAARPIPNAHTIWEMVIHLGVWGATVLRRIRGEHLNLTDDENWPAVNEISAETWERTKRTAIENIAQLREGLAEFDTERLNRSVSERRIYPAYQQVYGVLQHCGYHIGQIVLLKKLL